MPGSPTEGPSPVGISGADYLWFVDRALGAMVAIIEDLGDELANRSPDLPGANSTYVIVTHCLGVMEYWAGATVADRPITRDRAAEFVAQGSVAELTTRMAAARRRLEEDLVDFDAADAPTNVFPDPDDPVVYDESKGAVLVHILEELYQHLGQMELTRDILRAHR